MDITEDYKRCTTLFNSLSEQKKQQVLAAEALGLFSHETKQAYCMLTKSYEFGENNFVVPLMLVPATLGMEYDMPNSQSTYIHTYLKDNAIEGVDYKFLDRDYVLNELDLPGLAEKTENGIVFPVPGQPGKQITFSTNDGNKKKYPFVTPSRATRLMIGTHGHSKLSGEMAFFFIRVHEELVKHINGEKSVFSDVLNDCAKKRALESNQEEFDPQRFKYDFYLKEIEGELQFSKFLQAKMQNIKCLQSSVNAIEDDIERKKGEEKIQTQLISCFKFKPGKKKKKVEDITAFTYDNDNDIAVPKTHEEVINDMTSYVRFIHDLLKDPSIIRQAKVEKLNIGIEDELQGRYARVYVYEELKKRTTDVYTIVEKNLWRAFKEYICGFELVPNRARVNDHVLRILKFPTLKQARRSFVSKVKGLEGYNFE